MESLHFTKQIPDLKSKTTHNIFMELLVSYNWNDQYPEETLKNTDNKEIKKVFLLQDWILLSTS